jgi:uncharacterized protein YdgA (DUF945 family)
MKKTGVVFIFLFALFCVSTFLCYAQQAPGVVPITVKIVDLNKDGKPDITYYGEGKNVSKIEADTNYDGKSDVAVTLKNGKFESAEIDTDYNGSVDKKYTDADTFNQWLNKNHPEFHDDMYFSNGILVIKY